MAYMETIKLDTKFEGMHDVTAEVQGVIERSGIKEGIAVINCNHTTAGVMTLIHRPMRQVTSKVRSAVPA